MVQGCRLKHIIRGLANLQLTGARWQYTQRWHSNPAPAGHLWYTGSGWQARSEALLRLATANLESLTKRVYNVTSFSLTAGEIRDHVVRHFPSADISFQPDGKRQSIVDSWPADVNDDAARADWKWKEEYDADQAFESYLVPEISKYYSGK